MPKQIDRSEPALLNQITASDHCAAFFAADQGESFLNFNRPTQLR
jgi:hypothetical protein